MAKFELSYNGQRYEVEAPDEATALSAFQSQMGSATPTAEGQYNTALESVRQSQYANMTPEQWQQFSEFNFAPYNATDQFDQGASLGFADEIAAGIGAIGPQVARWFGNEQSPDFGTAYNQLWELEKARRDYGKESMGGLQSTASEIAGGLLFAGPRAVGGAVNALTSAVMPSRVANVAQGAATGGLMGGAYGFGSADEDRALNAGIGAATGGVVGAAAPLIAEAVPAAYRSLANRGARNEAAAATGYSPEAMQVLRQVTAYDDALGAAGDDAIRAAGGEAMLLDAGTNSQSVADALMRRPNEGAKVLNEALGARGAREAQRLNAVLDDALGAPEGVATLRADIAKGSSAARNAAYNEAYDSAIDYASEAGRNLESILANRVDDSIIREANAMMRRDGHASRQILAEVAEDGSVVYRQMPDVRQVDYITRALNDRAASNAGLGALGGQTAQGRSYRNLARELRDEAKIAAPAYGKALETAADPIGRSKATQFGYDMLGSRTPRDVAAREIAGMTGPEKQAVAAGVRSRIDESVANVTRAVSTGREDEVSQALRAMRDLTSSGNRDKIALAIGDDAAKKLFEETDKIFISLQREAMRRVGSQTAGRQMANDLINETVNSDSVANALLQGKPVNAAQRGVQALTGVTPESIAARGNQVTTDVARALASQGPELQNVRNALRMYDQNARGNDALAEAILQRGLGLGSALRYPVSMQLQNRGQ